jgi:alkanesulfonate monooxygenase SsuD/methylene tetrahydromethanopterin reductase-like flavin-dependent oxidoreductase (luciferase family)
MVVNLVGPRTAGSLASAYREAGGTGRVAAWVCTAVDPGPAALEQLRRGLVGYLGAPGYAEMFRAEGFGTVVDFAATRPHPRELLAAIPPEMVAAVGFIGSVKEIRTRMDEYREAGVDDLVIVPSATDENPAGERTLRALV